MKSISYIDYIKHENRPVCIYGMGNGAEKIISHLAKNGIGYEAVFASDGFVRGQEFLGKKVLSLSEAEEKYGDFIAVSAFALEGGLADTFYSFSKRHTLISPNLPPYGDGCIDAAYIKENSDKIARVREMLCDEESTDIFDSLLEYDVTGDISVLKDGFDPPVGWYADTYADIGAYDGDTATAYAKSFPGYKKIYAFEPGKVFSKLVKNTENLNIICENAAVYSKDGVIDFSDGKGRGSAIGGKTKQVKAISLDSYFADKPIGAIKIDGEGYDAEILEGGVNIICERHPSLCVAVYHRAYDLLDIPLWIKRQAGGYDFHLRRKKYVPAFDVFVYAIKKP